jgi:hypothetical protein
MSWRPNRSEKKSLFHQLYEIGQEERRQASRRQAKAGIKPVIKTDFKRASELSPEINGALQRLWDEGSLKNGFVDPVLRRLYTMVQKGLTSLSEADFIRFSKLSPEAMRAIGRWLVKGETFVQATWNARKEQERYESAKVRGPRVGG